MAQFWLSQGRRNVDLRATSRHELFRLRRRTLRDVNATIGRASVCH